METTIMENQMEKTDMENEMEIGVIQGLFLVAMVICQRKCVLQRRLAFVKDATPQIPDVMMQIASSNIVITS